MQSLLFILHNNYHEALRTLYYRNLYYFSGLYVVVNIHTSKKDYASLQNMLRKVKKRNYKKYRCNVIREVVFKAKRFGKVETIIKRDEFLFRIIAT